MPVKNLTDQRRMPRVGKIHLGVKKSTKDNSKKYPAAVDYFEVHADDTTPAPAAEAFAEVYGDSPRVLDVVFPSDDPAHLPDPWYKLYGTTTGLICVGDGETASARWDLKRDGPRPPGVEGGTWMTHQTEEPQRLTIPCLGEECPMQVASKCRMVLNLQFILPNVRGIGVWQIDTSSYHSVRNILDNIAMIKAAVGTVRGVPLKLSRVPKKVQPKGEAKSKNVYVLELSLPDVSLEELMRERVKVAESPLLLPPPVIDEEEVPDNIVEESDVDAETGELVMTSEEVAAAEQSAPDLDGSSDIPEGTPEFTTVGDFLNACWQQHSIDKPQVLHYLGFEDVDRLVGLNLQHAWLKLEKKLQAEQQGEKVEA